MHPILQNKFVRVGGMVVLVFVLVAFFLTIFLSSLNDARYGGGLPSSEMNFAPPSTQLVDYGSRGESEMTMPDSIGDSVYVPPSPQTGSYTADLESYETTSYNFSGKTKQFDEFCSSLKELKTDNNIHFRSLREAPNNCSANLFVEENQVDQVVGLLSGFKGIEYTRNTESVTKHKQQIESRTSIIQQQLASVQRSLTTAETQHRNLTDFYLDSDDVATLTLRVNESLRLIDQLTERKINLTNQLSNLYQQTADLEQRMKVIEIRVSVNRLNPIYANRNAGKWEAAWRSLGDTFDQTLISLTASLGMFLLWLLQITVYSLILIIIGKYLWRFVRLIWTK